MARIRLPVTIAAVVVAAGLVLACSDATAPGDAPGFKSTGTTPTHVKSNGSSSPDGVTPPQGYVYCTAQPYASDTATIGPAGGKIYAGKHELAVPKGALAEPVLITMEAPSDTVVYVKFSPHGLTFHRSNKPIVKLDYSKCPKPTIKQKGMVYSDDGWKVLEEKRATDDQSTFTVSAPIEHFSRYAIHY